MTLTDTRPETILIGLHALYPDASYGLSRLGVYLRTFDDAWRMCNWLALYRFTGRGDFGLGPPLSKAEIDQAPRTSLAIARLRIESPMDLAVVAQGGVTLVAAYSVHLLAQVLRHPDQIGTWLPRLVASWHDGWREAAQAKGLRRSAASASTSAQGSNAIDAVIKHSRELASTGLRPEAVTALGAGDPPDELLQLDLRESD